MSPAEASTQHGDWMTTADVAALFGVNAATVLQWGATGRLTMAAGPGHRRRFRTAEVHAADDSRRLTAFRRPPRARGAPERCQEAGRISPPRSGCWWWGGPRISFLTWRGGSEGRVSRPECQGLPGPAK